MTCYDTRSFGRRSSRYRQTSLKINALSECSSSQVCSEMAKAAVLEHQRLSGGINWINSQEQLWQTLPK